jgi:ABC-type amino acid transport substrate-binding protein
LAVASLIVLLVLAGGIELYRLTRPPEPDLSLERVQHAGELVVGLDPSYPPFEVVNGKGELDGLDVELARELGRRLGVRVRFVAVDFGSIFDALQVGKMDAILGGVSPDPDYAKTTIYTRPYFDDGLVLVVNQRAPNQIVGIESGSDADLDQQQLKAEVTGYRFQQFDDQDQIRASLAAAGLRGTIVDAATGREWAHQLPGLVVGPRLLTSSPFVVAVRIGDGKLRDALSATLAGMERDGFIAGLEQKWLT